ncbi:MAG: signal peptidase I [Deltaproteobacteria bacterium]|nr:signal peptidase I [Deltaproteobacteria bacterium]
MHLDHETSISRFEAALGNRVFCLGRSMYPTLQPGDLIEYEPVDQAELQPGDVIIFHNPGQPERLVVHRLLSRVGGRLVTQGDNNAVPDQAMAPAESVVGRALGFHRGEHYRRLRNGPPGRIQGRLAVARSRVLFHLRHLSVRLFRPFFHMLVEKQVLLRLLDLIGCRPRLYTTHVRRGGADDYWLMLGQRRIGRRTGDQKLWDVRSWHRLLVEPTQVVDYQATRCRDHD